MSEDDNHIQDKIENLKKSDYQNIEHILVIHCRTELSKQIKCSQSEVIVFTDISSEYESSSITNLVKGLFDEKVGCVCGILRKKPNENGKLQDSANWVYENKIKILESNIGYLSGANSAIYAVKRELLPHIVYDNINIDFYFSTYITQSGYYTLFTPSAVAYETLYKKNSEIFNKHIRDSVSAYISIVLFWHLLLCRKRGFVYVSHRVLKWIVPFNLILLLSIPMILSLSNSFFKFFVVLQIIGYLFITLYHFEFVKKNRDIDGVFGKLVSFVHYFIELNYAMLRGFICCVTHKM